MGDCQLQTRRPQRRLSRQPGQRFGADCCFLQRPSRYHKRGFELRARLPRELANRCFQPLSHLSIKDASKTPFARPLFRGDAISARPQRGRNSQSRAVETRLEAPNEGRETHAHDSGKSSRSYYTTDNPAGKPIRRRRCPAGPRQIRPGTREGEPRDPPFVNAAAWLESRPPRPDESRRTRRFSHGLGTLA